MLGPTTCAVEKRGSSTVNVSGSRITCSTRSRRVTSQASSAGTHDTGSRSRSRASAGCGIVLELRERHGCAEREQGSGHAADDRLPVMATTATERKLLIDGEWVETGDWVEVASPYDGSPVARVAKAGAAETRRAIDAAARAMESPLPAHKRAEILVRVAGALGTPRRRGSAADLRRGRQAAEGCARRGGAGDVDLHDGGRPGAHAGRRDGADGRVAGRRGQARVHAAPPDRCRRRDLAVQLPAQPRRAQDRARARGRLRRRPQARLADAALGAAARGARARGRAARRAG